MFDLFNKFIIIATVAAATLFAGVILLGDKGVFFDYDRMNGVNLVSTHSPLTLDKLYNLAKINANWVAVVPYAVSKKDQPFVQFNYRRQWSGEKTEGAINAIQTAKDAGYRVMLKPHVWVRGDGWPGDYSLDNEEDWQTWEKDYTSYLMTYASIADSLQVDLLCIATEFRQVVIKRPHFWGNLIAQIKTVYHGPLTYAANWDNYENVDFWDELDFIGIDAYFPLKNNKRPDLEELVEAWLPHKEKLMDFRDY